MLNQIKQTIMTAQEFYKENKGKYFMYENSKVRVVGMSNTSSPILVAGYEYGCVIECENSKLITLIDKSLINENDKLWFASIELLIPIEEELNLCELLKGCEGMVFYSTMVGNCELIEVNEYITIKYGYDDYVILDSDGKYATYGECTLSPSKDNRDWSTFVKPIKIKEGDPVMTKWNSAAFWKLESYAKDNKSDFIVPVSDFDFTDFDSNKSKSIK